MHLPVTVAAALAAGIADDLAGAAAGAAGTADGEKALLIENLAAPVASGASGRTAARFRARALAAIAGFHARHLDIGGEPHDRLLETDFQIVAYVFAALRASAPPAAATAAAEQIAEAEEIAQDVAEIGEGFGVESTRAPRILQSGVPEPVVSGSLLGVAQDTIGFRRLFEEILGIGIVGIAVRMVLERQFAIRGLDLCLAGILGHTKNFVIISF